MTRLVCSCLNVNVASKGDGLGEWQSQPVQAEKLFPQDTRDRLRSQTLYEVELDVAGVFAEQKALVVNRVVGDWLIHTCANCDTDVYITHTYKEERGRVFVTAHLVDDPVTIASTKRSEVYSPVFKITLSEKLAEDEEMFRRKRLSSMTFGRDDPVMKVLHAQMKSYLNKEQEAMEERIRRFEEEQREAFSQLQKKTHHHRSLLFSAIGRARENVISQAISEVSISKLNAEIASLDVEHPPEVQRETGRKSPQNQRSPLLESRQKVTITLKDRVPFANKATGSDKSPTDDSLFQLDGFDEEERLSPDEDVDTAFPQSDDEESSTDDSSYRDVSDLNHATIATSVPVSVPMFHHHNRETNRELSSSVQENRFAPEDVGNSIRQLALSVHDTGMFGDLPRPRISDRF